ncbi:hypothetical protein BDK89_2322 [Ilumatobacter fluminis]|uniref:Uncharacterized protein n=1 Tax=Ilumatobacter fluminis TaxID=467091 RepID=A0A4R7HZP6_9ACTN|nr:hypothetical protein [Ilumatobacter fluminis]TDT16727.1 hypothetical protein BDK89_2322 [Ilumatobacter fluminis]
MSITITPRSVTAFVAGIVVAVLGALVVADWRADAAVDVDETTFVPVTPCRLFDLRPGDENVGPRSTPLRADETYEQQVAGSNGDCVVPNGISGVALNVTIVEPTAASFLTIYPSDVQRPTASNLNWVAGQAATPNKVDVKVSAAGAIDLYNRFGDVFVLADVTGYYTASGLDQIEQRLAVLERTSTMVGSSGDPTDLTQLPVDGAIVDVTSFDLEAPGPGSIVVHSSATVSDQSPGAKIFCTISDAAELQTPFQGWESAGSDGSIGQLAGSRVFDVAAGSHTIWLICQSATGSIDPALGNVSGAVLSYVFVPD